MRIGIDFDGTILPFGPLTDDSVPPYTGVVETIKTLKQNRYEVIIHTSRLSPTWWREDYKIFGADSPEKFGEAQIKYVAEYLKRWDIPYDIRWLSTTRRGSRMGT